MPIRLFSLLILLSLAAGGAAAQETTLTVRVIAHDAKIIGTGVGGARVTVRNAATGAVLAEGMHEGSTGSTDRIMVEPWVRGASIFDTPGAARFVARVAIDTPTVVEVIAEGPLGYEHAMQRASKTLLLLPGEDVTGDGLVLELHGFIVELDEPTTARAGETVPVTVRVRMLCGCPHTPGGLWDANRIRVFARVTHQGQVLRETPLAYAGEPNVFTGSVSLREVPAGARLTVFVADPERANFGWSPTRVVE